MWPKSDLSFFLSYSSTSKAISPLYILLKICNGPLIPIKLIGTM